MSSIHPRYCQELVKCGIAYHDLVIVMLALSSRYVSVTVALS